MPAVNGSSGGSGPNRSVHTSSTRFRPRILAKHDINGPLNCLKPEGTLILVGATSENLEFSVFPLATKGPEHR